MRVSTRRPRRGLIIRQSIVVCLLSAFVLTTSLFPITSAQKVSKRVVRPSKVDSQAWSKYDQSHVSTSPKVEGDESKSSEVFGIPLSNFKRSKRGFPGPAQPVPPNLVATTDVGLESEPNGTSATANALVGSGAKIKGNISPNGDIDFYSFSASSGDRVYAAVMTSASASASFDSTLDLIGTDGTTVLETDLDDGSFGYDFVWHCGIQHSGSRNVFFESQT